MNSLVYILSNNKSKRDNFSAQNSETHGKKKQKSD